MIEGFPGSSLNISTQQIGRNHTSHVHSILGCTKLGSITKFGLFEIINSATFLDGHGDDIDAFVHAFFTNGLRSKDGARSEEHTSELQSHSFISYAVFCLKKTR